MQTNLYPHQKEALQEITKAHSRQQRVLLSLPTGTGKTMVAATYAKTKYLDYNKTILWIAHSEELLDQASATFVEKLGIPEHQVCRLYAGKEKLHHKPSATIWFMNNLVQNGPDLPDLIVIDEAHHAAAPTYTDILSQYRTYQEDGPKVLGLTATPYRLHEGEIKNLVTFKYSKPRKPIFESMAFSKSFCELVDIGRLAPFKLVPVHTGLSYAMHLDKKGDFDGRSLEQLNNSKRNRKIVADWEKNKSKYGKTLIFVGRQAHAKELAGMFPKGTADYAVSDDEDKEGRRVAIDRFRSGELQVLVNVKLFSEGVDVPDIKTVILARPTTSPMLFLQMIGRGSRIVAGKSFFYLVDIHDQLGKYESYLATVLDVQDRQDGPLVKKAERRAKAAESLGTRRLAQVAQDTTVLLDFLVLPVREYAGWVFFESTKGLDVGTFTAEPVGALLIEDELAALEKIAERDGRIPPTRAKSIGSKQGSSAAMQKCGRAFREGLCGRVKRFDATDLKEVTAASNDAKKAFCLGAPKVLGGLRDFAARLAEQAAVWGIKESALGRAQSEFMNNRTSYAGVIKLHAGSTGQQEPCIFLISDTTLELLKEAMRLKNSGQLDLPGFVAILGRITETDANLAPHGVSISRAIANSAEIAEFCVLAG